MHTFTDYAHERLLWDAPFGEAIGGRLAAVATALEDQMGGPQDIEGAIVGDVVYLLQARPQQL